MMRPGLTLGLLIASLSFLSSAIALTPFETPLSAEQQERYRGLIHELRCLVCQNQTIADSNADLAQDLRRQVHERIVAGESDDEIRAYVTERYGDFVLYNPPLKPRTLLLWAAPLFLVLFGLLAVWRFARRARPSTDSEPVDTDRLRKLLDEDR